METATWCATVTERPYDGRTPPECNHLSASPAGPCKASPGIQTDWRIGAWRSMHSDRGVRYDASCAQICMHLLDLLSLGALGLWPMWPYLATENYTNEAIYCLNLLWSCIKPYAPYSHKRSWEWIASHRGRLNRPIELEKKCSQRSDAFSSACPRGRKHDPNLGAVCVPAD
jgi:hypothetical protein